MTGNREVKLKLFWRNFQQLKNGKKGYLETWRIEEEVSDTHCHLSCAPCSKHSIALRQSMTGNREVKWKLSNRWRSISSHVLVRRYVLTEVNQVLPSRVVTLQGIWYVLARIRLTIGKSDESRDLKNWRSSQRHTLSQVKYKLNQTFYSFRAVDDK